MRLSAFAGVLLLGCTTVEAARLAAPSNVTPTGVESDAIEITWTTSEPNLVGFWVERSKPGKRRGFKKIATINDGSARSYVDSGLQSETIYYYRLRSLQEKRSRSGKLRRPKKSRKTKPVSGTTLTDAPAPQPTTTPPPDGPPPPPPPPPTGSEGNPFAMGAGSDETDIGVGVAVDSGGNIVVTGRFMDRADFGGSRISSRGDFDVFVARYAADGEHLWSKGFGGAEGDDGKSVAVDAAGNVFVTGFFRRSVSFGGSTLASAGRTDIFLAKFAPDGTHLWSQRFGGSGSDIGYAVGTDRAGNVVVAGSFFGDVSFGGGTLRPSPYARTDLFVAKFDSGGGHLWSKNYTSAGTAIAHGLAVGSDDSIAVTGLFTGGLDFGGNRLQSNNFTDDGFVAKLTADGTHRWSRSFGSTNTDFGSSVAMDDGGNVFVTGAFRHSVDFGGGALTGRGGGDVFVAKYASANGQHRWSRQGGGSAGTDTGTAITVDADGEATVTGWFVEHATFGSANLATAGERGTFLVRYGSNGQLRSTEACGSGGDVIGNGIATTPDGLVVTTGTFSGTASFRGNSLRSGGGHDAYLVQLTP